MAAYGADRPICRQSRRYRNESRRVYGRRDIPRQHPDSSPADKTSRRGRRPRANQDGRQATRSSPTTWSSGAGEGLPFSFSEIRKAGEPSTEAINHGVSNGTLRLDLRSIHAGTGKFFERRNSRLKSLV